MKESEIDEALTLNIMNRLAIFERFSPEEKLALVQFYRHYVVYSVGELVIKEGGHNDSFFIVLSGVAAVTTGGNLKPIATIKPGDVVGEMSFLTKRPRNATITAKEELIVIKVDELMLGKLEAETREKFKDVFIEKLVERLVNMNDMSALYFV